jgi:proclavaminate amidinohydrolase
MTLTSSRYEAAVPRWLGVPYEEGTYWRKGAKHGPEAVRAQIAKLRPESVSTGRAVPFPLMSLDDGDIELDPYNREKAFELIEARVRSMLSAGHAPVLVGGDHSITIPALRALSSVVGPDRLGVIHIDAHSDTFPPVNGYVMHHGAVFRVAVEEGLVRAGNLVQFGLRGTVREGGLDFAREHGIRGVSMTEWRKQGLCLAPFLPDGNLCYYVSLDIDAVDPAFAPGTGTPVPGGLSSSDVLALFAELAELPIVGADLVEIAPVYDPAGITALLGAHILFELMAHARFVKALPASSSRAQAFASEGLFPC